MKYFLCTLQMYNHSLAQFLGDLLGKYFQAELENWVKGSLYRTL